MSTIDVTGNYVVDSSENLTLGPSDDLGAYYLAHNASFTDNGDIQVTSNQTNFAEVGINGDGSAGYPAALIKIGLGATFSVSGGPSTGGFGVAIGGTGFENDGLFSVTSGSISSATGVRELSVPGYFNNTGTFEVSGGFMGSAYDADYGGVFQNSGTILVTGEHAYAVSDDRNTSEWSITNTGSITATATSGTDSIGIYLFSFYNEAHPTQITNSGTITAQTAIYVSAFANDATELVHLTNTGTINGALNFGIGPSQQIITSQGFQQGAQIYNTGAINGAINLDTNGNDLYLGVAGTQSGGITPGAGNDIILLGNDGETVNAGSGGNDVLIGGTGSDTISGGPGNDLIVGGGGSDVLTGGAGADTFVIAASSSETVTDFSDAQGDKIDLTAFSTISSLADVQAHAVQSGSNTVITIGGATLTLQNVQLANLTAADFAFGGNSSPIEVSGAQTVGATSGALQTVVFSGERGGFGAYDLSGAANLVDDASIVVVSTKSNIGLTGIWSNGVLNPKFTIGSNASLVVVADGSGSGAEGFLSGYQAASFENDGLFIASSTSGPTGVSLIQGGTFLNTGTLYVLGQNGITTGLVDGGGGTLTNSGAMTVAGASAEGVNFVSANETFTNSGSLTVTANGGGGYALVAVAGQQTFINSGTVTADGFVASNSNSTIDLHLVNSGTINSLISLGAGSGSEIDNSGTINGEILLNTNGASSYFGAHGTHSAALVLWGGTYTVVLGNDGELVEGGAGSATITGGTGNDTVVGWTGALTFAPGGGGGGDHFLNFSAQIDKIDLSAFGGMYDLTQVLANTTQSGADTIINYGAGTITLDSFQDSGLTSSDFIYGPILIATSGTTVTINSGETVSRNNGNLAYYSATSGGTLINNGTLSLITSSSANAISTNSEPDPSALFQNNGQFTFQDTNAAAIAYVTVQNTGTMSITGTQDGIGFTGNLTNAGTITVHGGTQAEGVETANSQGSVDNQSGGSITVSSSSGPVVGALFSNGMTFENDGTFTVNGSGVDHGVETNRGELSGPTYAYGTFVNSGQFTVTGAAASIGLYMTGSAPSPNTLVPSGQYNVINSGTLTAPIAIEFAYSLPAAIDNSGTINGAVVLSSYNDVLLNTGTINGAVNLGAGNDTLISTAGTINGTITLGAGAKTVTLGAENNTVVMGSGVDAVDGGGGTNTASFANATAGVTVNLTLQGSGQNTIGAGTDTLNNFQNLTGSAYNDTLQGDANNNVLDGGGGINTVSYAGATSGVTVSLGLQGSSQNTVGAGTDTLINFRNLTGSAYNDTLQGDANNNVLDGAGGTNTVSYAGASAGVTVSLGLQGQAQNTVGAGTDTLSNFQNLIGSSHNDTLTAGTGAESLTGGLGADTFVFKPGAGADVVTDFSDAQGDRIDLSSFSGLYAWSQVTALIAQSGSNTVISLPAGGAVTLDNVQASSLTSADFILSPSSYSPIQVTGVYTVGVGQNLTFSGSNGGLGAYDLYGSAGLIIQGSVLVQDALPNDAPTGVHTESAGATQGLAIASGASLIVTSQGSGSGAFGFYSDNESSVFGNGGTFSVSAQSGAAFGLIDGAGGLLVNTGALTASGLAARAIAGWNFGGGVIVNSGAITATQTSGGQSIGLQLGSPTGGVETVWNWGTLSADIAIEAVSPGAAGNTTSLDLNNFGTITGELLLAAGSGSQIDNTGAINGAIYLGAYGADTYDGRGGTQTGGIYLGYGTGTVYLGNDGETVHGAAGSAVIIGGTGADTIIGGSNSDSIDGGGGNDTLTGGLGADSFVFKPGYGGAVVTDFSDTQGDRINLSAFSGLHTFSDVQPLLSQSGPNAVIALPGGGSVTLHNVMASSLTQADFTLAAHPPADFTGSGMSGLAWDGPGGLAAAWELNGTSIVGGGVVASAPGWQVQDTGDFAGDGKSGDMVLRNQSTGDMAVWDLNGTQITGGGFLVTLPTEWQVMGTADFNGDGKSDILLRDELTGAAAVWEMNGPQIQGGGILPSGLINSHIVGTGDFNGDGLADILWKDPNSGNMSIWEMNGTSLIGSGAIGSMPAPWKVVGTGDFNGDGKSDILFYNQITGSVDMWEMNGTALTASSIFAGVPTNWHVAAVADINGDGKSDIIWQDSSTGQVVAWEMNGFAIVGGGNIAAVDPSWTIVNHHYDWV